MTALLALIPAKDWLYGGLIIALIVFGIHEHHKLLAEGIAEQKAADTAAAVVLEKQTAAQTAELQAKATMAEQAYDKSQSDLAEYRSTHPVQPVRLCLNAHAGGGVLPQAGAAQPGAKAAGAAPLGVQPVPAPDRSVRSDGTAGPDLASLLDALAARADEVSAQLQEYQARQ